MLPRGLTPEDARRMREAQHRRWLEQTASEIWGERYRLAIATGFSDGDARLHADTEVTNWRSEHGK